MSNSDRILKVILQKFDVETFLIVSKYLKETSQNEQNIFQGNEKVTEDGNKENVETNAECVVDEVIGHENKTLSEIKKPSREKSAGYKERTLSYDLNKLEDYIAKNMETIECGSLNETTGTSHTELNVTREKEKSAECIELNEIVTEREQVQIPDHVAYEIPTQKSTNADPKYQQNHTEVISLDDDDDMENIIAPPIQETVFQQPFVAETFGENNPQIEETANVINIVDDITNTEDMYCLPTQEIVHNCVDSHQALSIQENYDSVEELLHLLENSLTKCLANLKSTDAVLEVQLHNLQYYITKLKSLKLHERDESKSDNRNVCDATAQTLVATSEQHVQTEDEHQTIGVQTGSIYCCKCSVDLNDNEVRPKLITQCTEDAMKSMLDEPEMSFKPVTQPKLSKEPSQNDILTETFDNLNFETQDLTKNEANLMRNTGKLPKVATRAQALPDATETLKPSLPSSVLVCSLTPADSKKVNRKLNFEGEKSKKFKRIRTLSGSDSDDEPKAKRLCNRFVREDLTIEFQTNPERVETQNKSYHGALDSQDSEGINYDNYLAQIMKKYDANSSSGSSKAINEPTILASSTESMRKSGTSLKQASKNKKSVKKLCSNSSKGSYQLASNTNNNIEALSADRMFMDEDTLSKLEKDVQNYEQQVIQRHNSETSDIISNTEEEPVLKKFRRNNTIKNNSQLASLFCLSDNDDVHMQEQKNHANNDPESDSLFVQSENPDPQLQDVKTTTLNRNPESASLFCESREVHRSVQDGPVCTELDDSFDEGELENLDIPDVETGIKKADRDQDKCIRILQDVIIKTPVKVRVNKEEDDIFSDEDIVETTPHKRVDSFGERCGLSQSVTVANPLFKNLTVPKSATENFDFDFVPLPPPPDFQDDNETADNGIEDVISVHDDDVTIVNNLGSLTPDRLSQFVVRDNKEPCKSQILSTNKEYGTDSNLSLTPDKLSQFDVTREHGNVSHSSPVAERNITRDTLSFSPIPLKKTPQFGITEMAAAAKYTPLSSITKQTSHKQNLYTSTPRQKSIWNYVQTPQVSDKEVATPKTKPCIACTRLTKDQVKLISQLTNKKLATYSPQFNLNVTHMIVAVNENNYVKDYTIKFVSAVAAGIWVLRYEWVEECLSNNCIVPEEPFEALDTSGIPGPKTARLTRKQNPLFKGFKFYCVEPFPSTSKEEIENFLTLLGGKVLQNLKSLLEDDGNIGLIIGEGHATQDFEQFERWVGLYKTVTVDIEWLSKCVGQYKLLSIRPYIWCTEDSLANLEYPPSLIENSSLSFSEAF